ncbi:9295_t:CDS:1, partial [Gigaspora margarita]
MKCKTNENVRPDEAKSNETRPTMNNASSDEVRPDDARIIE